MKKIELSKKAFIAAVDSLYRAGCCFFACEGFTKRPKSMITCHRCRALHNIFKEHPELKKDYEQVDREY